MSATFTDHPGGDIFASGADLLVCPVNCAGAMGKGLALAFRERFGMVFAAYVVAIERGALRLGKPSLVKVDAGQRVILFPTKQHWRSRSRLSEINPGLVFMASALRYLADHGSAVQSIAIPALGCGLGGLAWADVRPLIVETLAPLPLRVMLYPPHEAP